jgi:hypothetical protein
MGTPWKRSVRDTKTLTVFNGIAGGHWANIFVIALEAFNKFAKPVGIKMVQAKDEDSANIVMRLADGAAKFEFLNKKYQNSFSGTGLHGLTKTLAIDGEIQKAFVFLPERPQVTDFDNKGNMFEKMASQDVMKVIAVHELIHACGLDEMRDHGGDGIFYYPLAYQNGKVYVPERGKNQALMPPVRPDGLITGKIKALW